MRKVLPLLSLVLFSGLLLADQWVDKHDKYGTTPEIYEPYLRINPDYAQSQRSTDVLLSVGGGSWIGETSWSIVDAAGVEVVAGGGDFYVDVPLSLDDGVYTVNMADSYGDGWNGNVLTVEDAATSFLYFSGTLDGINDDGSTGTGSFELPQVQDIPGCMDVTACNYNDSATSDDGSCCLTNCGNLTCDGGSYQSEVSWEITDAAGTVIYTGGAPSDQEVCLEDGTYMVKGYDSYGDGWNGNTLTILNDMGQSVVDFTFDASAGPCNNPASSSTNDLGECDSLYFTLPLDPPTNNLVLASILDLTVPEGGNAGKAIVVQATGDVADMSVYGLGIANNGGGTDGQEYTFPMMGLDSGEVLWIVRDETAYINYFGESLGMYVVDAGGSVSQNGDDAIELYHNGAVVDLFGDVDTDGTGEAWEYLDSWVFRNCDARTPSTTFNLADWTLGGVNCTDGSTNNTDSSCPFPADELECAAACELTEVTAVLTDSYGDGWNGNVLSIANGLVELTLDGVNDDGVSASFDLCLPDGLHPVTCDGGSWQTEVSWELLAADGTVLLAGGAPFEGFLQIGEVADVPGCTDPAAYNYNPDATIDDGSCYYDGDLCEVALPAVEGEAGNAATGAEQWFSYTATMTGTIVATTCYADQPEDTDVDVFTGTCEALVAVGSSDDAGCGDITGGNNYASEIEFDVVTGETYYFFWDDTWGPGAFTWYLYESPPPTNPQNFAVWGGVERAYMEWDGIVPPMRSSGLNINTYNVNQAQIDQEYYNQKKEMIHPDTDEVHASGWVNPDHVGNTRQLVTIECDGGDWQSEVSWELWDDATATVVASGGAPAGTTDENGYYVPLTADLDGSYTLMAYDAYGDGWNGNMFTVFNETTTFISWTLESGSEGSVTFTVSDDVQLANLSLSNLMYDQATDILSVDVTNDGGLGASDVGMSYHFTTELSADCNNDVAEFVFNVGYVGPGETVNFPVSGLEAFLGYGTYNVGHLVDYFCTVEESNEEDNTISATVEIVDPLEGITFNVYRAVDEAAPAFTMVATGIEEEYYMEDLAEGDYVWYVTQVTADVESDSSNYDYATVFGGDDFPAPLDLMVEGNDYDALLEWTAPDLAGWEPPMTSSFNPTMDKPDPIEATNSTPPSTRQGGDTFDGATVIEYLPYENAGTTVGYFPDYGPYDEMVDADGDGYPDLYCEYLGWLGSTGAGPDVVYALSLADATNLQVSLCGSGYDTALGIFTMEDDGTGTMVPVLVAANDDFCALQSEINCELPAGDYFLVVSGYSANEGDYTIVVQDLDDVPPVAGYVVYRDGEPVGQTVGIDATTYEDTDLEDPENPGTSVTHTYEVTAYYAEWDLESVPSNEATVTLPVLNCYAPPALMAETMSNNVMLEWESVPGQGGFFGWFNGELATGIGAGASPFEVAALVPPEELADMDGMAMTKVAFVPWDIAESFKVFVYDPVTGLPVDSTELIDGAALPLGDWYEVDLPNPVLIDATQPLMFGYRVIGVDGAFPAGADSGPAVQGFGDLIKGFGVDWGSMAYQYGLDYNWALEGYATFAPGRSISTMDPVEVAIPIGNSNTLAARETENPVTLTHPADRSLLGYHVYRGDHHVGHVGPGELMFVDDWVPWGDYTYNVTAQYDHGVEGACSESEPAMVDVSLMNSAPGEVMLQTPADGSTFEITVDEDGMPNNLDTEVQFFWTQANDPDNDVVHYNPHAHGHVDGTTYMEIEAPVMAQPNPSFEDNAGSDTPLAPWGTWPPELANFSFETNGNGIFGSDATLEVYDGEHALKVWGQYSGTYPNNTPVYQGHSIEAMWLQPGDAVAIEGHMMSHADDWVGQGANSAYLFISFFDADWGFLGSSLSHMMDRTMPPSEWHQFFALAVVPEGAVNMNAGVEYWQVSGDDHGSVYFDDVNMFVPVTQSIIRVSYEEMVMEAMADSVHHMTVDWNVNAMDVWDHTPSSNGPFSFTMDLSAAFEELGIDGDLIPDVFALHNNYPNPFNPVTNITYDIPEVADVSLEIYNVMGQKVRTLATGSHEPGRYRVLWNATNDYGEGLSSGMYIYRIQAGDFVSVKKLILMK